MNSADPVQGKPERTLRLSTVCIVLLLSTGALVHPVFAEPFNRVDLQAEAGHTVANDTLVASMAVEVQDKDTARVARRINRTINAALDTAKQYQTVKVGSGWQSTSPVYGKNNDIIGWRGAAQINLESRDFNAAGALIGALQGSLHLTGTAFQVSPEARADAENALIAEAIRTFNHRADIVRQALNAAAFKIVHISVSTVGGGLQPYLALDRAMSAAPAPKFSAGESHIVVRVTGTVELEDK